MIICLTGTMAETLAKLDPKNYQRKMIKWNGKKFLYTKVQKAIYDTLHDFLLFWKIIIGKLAGPGGMGFVPNLYNAYTMNKSINGHQCTIIYHIDNIKEYHKEGKDMVAILWKLEKIYRALRKTKGEEKIALWQTYEDIQKCVGMTINFLEKKKVIISMFDYIEDAIKNLSEF